jgi:hypothetical protein
MSWEQAWVPILPSKEPTTPSAFHVVLLSESARNLRALSDVQNGQRIHGTIFNPLQSFRPDVEEELIKRYPDTDFKNCLILYHDHLPISNRVLALVLGGAMLLLLGSLGCFVHFNFRRSNPPPLFPFRK